MSTRIPRKTSSNLLGFNETLYHVKVGDDWEELHREDGPALIREYNDGSRMEVWYYEGEAHRYGGPAYLAREGSISYFVDGHHVSDIVNEWLSEMGYFWETMNEHEKWELEIFMRTI